MDIIRHPEDSTLTFPYVKDTLPSPEKMISDLFYEYTLGKQDYDLENNILYRPYEENFIRDAVSSHFTEHVRVNCISNKKPTLVKAWESMSPSQIRKFKTTDELRMYLFKTYKAGECNYFHAGLCIRLYLGFNDSRKPIKIIDPSAGWGCRMITAIACGDYVSQYDGYDPNPNLAIPFGNIMRTLDHKNKCRFFSQPFETAEVPKQYYDLGVTSPPYFDLEIYNDNSTQSISNGKNNYERWIEEFYVPYLKNLHYSIRPGGKIIIYISNYSSDGKLIDLEKQTLDILLKRIGNVKLSLKGELRNDRGYVRFPRPFFVFEVL